MPICTCPVCKVVNPRGLQVSCLVKYHHDVEARAKAIHAANKADKASTVGRIRDKEKGESGDNRGVHIGTIVYDGDAGRFAYNLHSSTVLL